MRIHWSSLAVFGALVACNAVLGIPEAGRADGAVSSSSSGSSGTTVKVSCPNTQKACNGRCVALDNPATGCGNTDCKPCAVQNADATCDENGKCAYTACNDGFRDCNNKATDGCESESATDRTNCGDCGNQCEGSLSCNDGSCGCQSDAECRQGAGGKCSTQDHICFCIKDGQCNDGVACTNDDHCDQ